MRGGDPQDRCLPALHLIVPRSNVHKALLVTFIAMGVGANLFTT